MNELTTNIKSIRVIDNGKTFLLTDASGKEHYLSVNLVKYQLDIPYMKSDGTPMTVELIREKKRENAKKYREAKNIAS